MTRAFYNRVLRAVISSELADGEAKTIKDKLTGKNYSSDLVTNDELIKLGTCNFYNVHQAVNNAS